RVTEDGDVFAEPEGFLLHETHRRARRVGAFDRLPQRENAEPERERIGAHGRANGITIRGSTSRDCGRYSMRSARVLLVPLMMLTLVVTACGGTAPAATGTPGASAAAATQTPKPSPIKIKSSYGNVTPSNLAPFLAKELGIFEKYNLDVTLDLIDGGVASSAARVGQHAGRQLRRHGG